MITKGEILSINLLDNTCVVRLPVFETTPSDNISTVATFSIQPGLYNGYQVGDIVYVGFEQNDIAQAVILGKLYIEAAKEASTQKGAINCSTLRVTDKVELPSDTQITFSDPDSTIKTDSSAANISSIRDIVTKTQNLDTRVTTVNNNLSNELEKFKKSTAENITGIMGYIDDQNENVKTLLYTTTDSIKAIVSDAEGRISEVAQTAEGIIATVKENENKVTSLITATEAKISANKGNKTWSQEEEPENASEGDLWWNTKENKLYRFDGFSWELQEDASIKDLKNNYSSLSVKADEIAAEVVATTTNLQNNYLTIEESKSLIQQTADSITQTVSKKLEISASKSLTPPENPSHGDIWCYGNPAEDTDVRLKNYQLNYYYRWDLDTELWTKDKPIYYAEDLMKDIYINGDKTALYYYGGPDDYYNGKVLYWDTEASTPDKWKEWPNSMIWDVSQEHQTGRIWSYGSIESIKSVYEYKVKQNHFYKWNSLKNEWEDTTDYVKQSELQQTADRITAQVEEGINGNNDYCKWNLTKDNFSIEVKNADKTKNVFVVNQDGVSIDGSLVAEQIKTNKILVTEKNNTSNIIFKADGVTEDIDDSKRVEIGGFKVDKNSLYTSKPRMSGNTSPVGYSGALLSTTGIEGYIDTSYTITKFHPKAVRDGNINFLVSPSINSWFEKIPMTEGLDGQMQKNTQLVGKTNGYDNSTRQLPFPSEKGYDQTNFKIWPFTWNFFDGRNYYGIIDSDDTYTNTNIGAYVSYEEVGGKTYYYAKLDEQFNGLLTKAYIATALNTFVINVIQKDNWVFKWYWQGVIDDDDNWQVLSGVELKIHKLKIILNNSQYGLDLNHGIANSRTGNLTININENSYITYNKTNNEWLLKNITAEWRALNSFNDKTVQNATAIIDSMSIAPIIFDFGETLDYRNKWERGLTSPEYLIESATTVDGTFKIINYTKTNNSSITSLSNSIYNDTDNIFDVDDKKTNLAGIVYIGYKPYKWMFAIKDKCAINDTGQILLKDAILNSATINGAVNATSGHIGNLNITNNELTTGPITISDDLISTGYLTAETQVKTKLLTAPNITTSTNKLKLSSPERIVLESNLADPFNSTSTTSSWLVMGIDASSSEATTNNVNLKIKYTGDGTSGSYTYWYFEYWYENNKLPNVGTQYKFTIFTNDSDGNTSTTKVLDPYIGNTAISASSPGSFAIKSAKNSLFKNEKRTMKSFKIVSSATGVSWSSNGNTANQIATFSEERYTGGTEHRIFTNCHIIPDTSQQTIGTSDGKWNEVWSYHFNEPSDRNLKNTILPLEDTYESFFNDLKPVSYKFNDGTSGRTHVGFISQDVEQSLLDNNMTTLDFAGFLKDIDDDGIARYGLRYGEFIALNTDQIQKLKKRVKELEDQIEELKNK